MIDWLIGCLCLKRSIVGAGVEAAWFGHWCTTTTTTPTHFYSCIFFIYYFPTQTNHSHFLSLKNVKLVSQPITSTPNLEVQVMDHSPITLPRLHNYHEIHENQLQNIVYDALVFATLNGLLVGDKSDQVIVFSFFILILEEIINFTILNSHSYKVLDLHWNKTLI